MADLTALERIAIAGAIKEKESKDLKSSLKEGSNGTVDFKVRITGTVTKGAGQTVASFSFASMGAMCCLLKNLGIGEQRLQKALEELPDELVEDPRLATVFDAAGRERAKRFPKSKQGTVNTTIVVQKL